MLLPRHASALELDHLPPSVHLMPLQKSGLHEVVRSHLALHDVAEDGGEVLAAQSTRLLEALVVGRGGRGVIPALVEASDAGGEAGGVRVERVGGNLHAVVDGV